MAEAPSRGLELILFQDRSGCVFVVICNCRPINEPENVEQAPARMPVEHGIPKQVRKFTF